MISFFLSQFLLRQGPARKMDATSCSDTPVAKQNMLSGYQKPLVMILVTR
jgi:hypothetical protein